MFLSQEEDTDRSYILVLTLSKKLKSMAQHIPGPNWWHLKCAGFDAFSTYWQSSVSTLILFVPATVGHPRRLGPTIMCCPGFSLPLPGSQATVSCGVRLFKGCFPFFAENIGEKKENKTAGIYRTDYDRLDFSEEKSSPFQCMLFFKGGTLWWTYKKLLKLAQSK